MSTEDQSVDERLIYDIVFNHFKRHKVEISRAIKKGFPFFEILRDRELITNKMYEDCQESCRNLVPVQRVVYHVLSRLEETFDLPLLEALFCEINRQEYPELNNIYKGFENAIHEKLCFQESNEECVANSNTQLRLEQGTGENSYQRLTWICSHPSNCNGTAPPENGLSEHRCEREWVNASERATTSDNNDALESLPADEQCAQEAEFAESCKQVSIHGNNENARMDTPSPLLSDEGRAELPNHEVQINSCSVLLVDIKKEKPFFNQNVEKQTQTHDVIVISSDEDEPPKAPTWEQRKRPESNEEGEIQEATCSAPDIAPHTNIRTAFRDEKYSESKSRAPFPEPMDLRKSPTCRKRLWNRGRSHERSFESSEDEAPPVARTYTMRSGPDKEDSPDIGNQSTWGMSNKKRWINSGDFSELSNQEEPQETSSSALRNGSGIMDVGSSSTSEKHSGKRREKRRRTSKNNNLQRGRKRGRPKIQRLNNRVPWKRSKAKGIKAVNTEPLKRCRRRGPRIPRDKNMNFKPPILPVTCGQAKGMLYKEEMKQGILAKCIKMKDGKWLTLKEFEIEGNHERSKNWRMSVRCGGWPLKNLIQKKLLPDPPRTRRKTIPEPHSHDFIDPYPENSNECEVCHKRGKLFCCDTCPRSFHKECHIRHIDPDRNPWSCIFCQMKIIEERHLESQPCHQESEVLKRKMQHEERLKCEFLLLKVYSCSESPFFARKQDCSEKALQGLKKCMSLNKIRKKLVWRFYCQVKGFVQDMRLIFQNHKCIYRDNKFIMLGLQLEAKFENNFKKIFAIQ